MKRHRGNGGGVRGMRRALWAAVALGALSHAVANGQGETAPAPAAAKTPEELTRIFAELPALTSVSLSPDGRRISMITPTAERVLTLQVVGDGENDRPRRVLHSSGNPEFFNWCQWATDARFVCQVYTMFDSANGVMMTGNFISVNDDGTSAVLLSNRHTDGGMYIDYRGGRVIDWLPNAPGSILMLRNYVPSGRSTGAFRMGMGLDRVDIATGRVTRVLNARSEVINYITDGVGNIRIMATQGSASDGTLLPEVRYRYRSTAGGSEWTDLATYNVTTGDGIFPVAVDAARNVAFAFTAIDGRQALISIALDGTMQRRTEFAHDKVDVDDLIRVGRSRRVVGVSYVTDRRHTMMTDPALARLTASFSRALGGQDVAIVDASADESRYLVWAGSDTNPGTYYLYVPASRELRMLFDERPDLEQMTLSPMRPITYPARDGVQIPGYLTLPPGRSDARGLPAIVLPHGGPGARDELGFDWLSQYFAQLGYAVLQPNFRGSTGYGEAWYENNGFQSWRSAIGDIIDGGRWLTGAQGADPAKLSIVGWSYGGYAALQSAVTEPDVFKAVVAIAPVTDLRLMRREAGRYTNGRIARDFIGTGPHLDEGSPARQASRITAPVLMFHGSYDLNVNISQARAMERALRSAGKPGELIVYDKLEHSLASAQSRRDMLTRITAFLPH